METTKEKIFTTAYKLFASLPYNEVTYDLLVKETGFARGTIIYHAKSKKALFLKVFEEFVLKESSSAVIEVPEIWSFKEFIKYRINTLFQEKKKYASKGFKNLNITKFNIEIKAYHYCEQFKKSARQWLSSETDLWQMVIETAIKRKELKADINTKLMATMFIHIYMGASFAGISNSTGYDIVQLRKEFMALYNLIKV
ncbi:MAG: TetR/AcrR family transcriptional regulator [Tannerellaceae bacterium]|nr:TetR/AcrR family transcriptional regulator [Tannerellaceae bacterium]